MNPIPTHSTLHDLEIRYSSWFEVDQFSHSPSTHHSLKLPHNTTTNSLSHPTSFLSNYQLISFHFLPINIRCKTAKVEDRKIQESFCFHFKFLRSLCREIHLTVIVALKNLGRVCSLLISNHKRISKRRLKLMRGVGQSFFLCQTKVLPTKSSHILSHFRVQSVCTHHLPICCFLLLFLLNLIPPLCTILLPCCHEKYWTHPSNV